MKRIIPFLLAYLLLAGCIQSKEHLVLNKDGSGILESTILVPQGTVYLLDSILGGMIQTMRQTFGEAGTDKFSVPESIAEETFGNKKEILKKAKKAKVHIEFIEFKKEMQEDGLHVDFQMKFDDIVKFLEANIMAVRLGIQMDGQGRGMFFLKGDTERKAESEARVGQLKNYQGSEEFKKLDPVIRESILSAMDNFVMEYLVTLPYQINVASGVFAQIDDSSVRFEFKGNFLKDPTIIEKLYGQIAQDSRVVWGDEAAVVLVPEP